MSTVAHHDQSRFKVIQTAFGVATFRALETAKGNEALIQDPWASLFHCPESAGWIQSLSLNESKLESMVTGISVRTYKIDKEVSVALHQGVEQVVVLGAGLDCRPWRIHNNADMKDIDCSRVKWFEVDFAEVFEYKLGVLAEANAQSPFQYINVAANAAIENWTEKLQQAGYDLSKPAIWILEGFTGYLSEDELSEAMKKLTDNTAKGSVLIATFLGTQYAVATSMHRYQTDEPLKFVEKWSWDGIQEELSDICVALNRGKYKDAWKSYYFVIATLI